MSELTNGAYAEIQKGVKGIKTYLKFSRLDAYAMMKLMQFIKRAAKENIVTQGYTEEFTDFCVKAKVISRCTVCHTKKINCGWMPKEQYSNIWIKQG